MLSREARIVVAGTALTFLGIGGFLVYKAYAQPDLSNATAKISTDSLSYTPRSVMVVTVQVSNAVTGAFIPKASVTLILNGVPQKVVLTDGKGSATTTLISPLGGGTHILQAEIGDKIVGSTSFAVVWAQSVQYAGGRATGAPRMMRREP